MKATIVAILGLSISAACGPGKSTEPVEPAETTDVEGPAVAPEAPPAEAPPGDSATSSKDFAADLVAALGAADPSAVVALTLTPEQLRPMLATFAKNCPDKMPADKIDEAVTQMGQMLGTAEERQKTYAGYHAECRKLGDFAGASVVGVEERDKKEECGGAGIRNLVIETSSGGKTLFVRVNDLLLTPAGWRMPDPFTCTTERP